MTFLNGLLATGAGPDIDGAVSPIYNIVSVALPVLLGLIFLIGVFKCISLGIAFSKSDENGTHEKAKKDLINGIVGFSLIFILVGVMYLLKDPLISWLEGITGSWDFNN